jgi:hypothetical protein
MLRIVINLATGFFGFLSAYFWIQSAYYSFYRQHWRWLKKSGLSGRRPSGTTLSRGPYRAPSRFANYFIARANAIAAITAAIAVLLTALGSFL